MKASELKLEELFDLSEGNLNLHGRRLVIHDMHAFAQFRKDLLDMVGLENARRILTRFGYFWGQADAAAMNRIFQWDNREEWLRAGARLHTLQGVANTAIKSIRIEEDAGPCHMEVTWRNSGEAEEHLSELGLSGQPVCWILTGYASGYVSYCLGQEIYFYETKCRAKSDRICAAVGKDLNSWGENEKSHLTYFESRDIHGKIQQLTTELRKKQREIAQHKKLIDQLSKSAPPFVEVHSATFRQVIEMASHVAPFDTSVLITGASGTGKEVMARYIHQRSNRAAYPFVAVNCGALPETLLESELFGHKAGSFTGAIHDRVGLFEQANKGTLFLDEIGDISPAMQLKLLRVLQEREIMRVGESKVRKIDVRVMAATNKNLKKGIKNGLFREDLYYRLGVIEIEIPPLARRKEDILPLSRYFVKQFAKKFNLPNLRLDATCFDYLQSYSWPGNVRELENAIERAAVLSKDGWIRPAHLPPSILHAGAAPRRTLDPLRCTLSQVEEEHIRTVLELVNGNRTKAAEVLGISPATLWRKLKSESPPPGSLETEMQPLPGSANGS